MYSKMQREKHQSSSFLLAELSKSAQSVVARAHLVRLVLCFPPLEVRDLVVQGPPLVLHHPLLVGDCSLGEKTSQILVNTINNNRENFTWKFRYFLEKLTNFTDMMLLFLNYLQLIKLCMEFPLSFF